MHVGLVTLANLLSVCALATNAPATGEGASYPALEPGVFVTRWLVCGPFPVVEGKEGTSVDEKTQRQAFYRDYLVQHGGEANIEPNERTVVQYNGQDYKWQRLTGEGPTIDLTNLWPKDYVVAYAWAEFDMPEAKRGQLAIGSDDAVRVWLNGELTFPLHGKVPSPLNGIEPHVLVTPTILDLRAARDPVLEKAIALLPPPTRPLTPSPFS